MSAPVKAQSPRLSPAACKFLFERADEAGRAAAEACVPEPLIVAGYENQPIMGGVCGFAWVNVKPGNSSFARWLKANVSRSRSDSYYGGVSLWISAYGQSFEKKHSYAAAFANVLSEAGIRAYAMSRLD